MFPDASCESDSRVVAADRQQLRVPAVPAVLLQEVRQQGETPSTTQSFSIIDQRIDLWLQAVNLLLELWLDFKNK